MLESSKQRATRSDKMDYLHDRSLVESYHTTDLGTILSHDVQPSPFLSTPSFGQTSRLLVASSAPGRARNVALGQAATTQQGLARSTLPSPVQPISTRRVSASKIVCSTLLYPGVRKRMVGLACLLAAEIQARSSIFDFLLFQFTIDLLLLKKGQLRGQN
ncbi:uncharacterized protein EV154DRAFT_478596 [Mucor mucedo]|uniref:uncharacterized protein n=1 Tax=Mucor mucedo TaxID=29922 RepID=UPI00221ECD3C|nr:uncharacterized protein EV154DRAFT_478596 [Mucor mucedo]KAI7894083.1 hypothetical protein EV154DRAFT_478596 [Mucor mucedo]